MVSLAFGLWPIFAGAMAEARRLERALDALEKNVGDLDAWERLRGTIEFGTGNTDQLINEIRNQTFVLNLLGLVTPSKMLNVAEQHRPPCKVMREFIRTRKLQTCNPIHDIHLASAAYTIEAAMAHPYIGSGTHTFGEVAVIMFLCGEILPKASAFYNMSQSPSKMVEGRSKAKTIAGSIDHDQIRMMRDIHTAMIKRGDVEAAGQLKRSMAINGATEGSVTYIEWEIQVEAKNGRKIDPMMKMTEAPKNLSAHMVRLERKHVSREVAANHPEQLDLPKHFLEAMLTCNPLVEFIAVIRMGGFAWTFVIARSAKMLPNTDVSTMSDALIKQMLVKKAMMDKNKLDDTRGAEKRELL